MKSEIPITKSEIPIKNNTHMMCINCGHIGHSYRTCYEPKTSYGIIAIQLNKTILVNLKKYLIEYLNTIDDLTLKNRLEYLSEKQIKKFAEMKNEFKLLMIMRRHSLGFMDFIRGHYNPDNLTQLKHLFEEMTPQEISEISENIQQFESLWNKIWVNESIPLEKLEQSKDFAYAKKNFEKVRETQGISIDKLITFTKSKYSSPEWGFPKGRRSGTETDIECARREFHEETGLFDDDYVLFENIKPLVENLDGTNGIKYRHVYFLALLKDNVEPKYDKNIKSQWREIGDIGLYNVDDALQKIRPHHTERQKIITNVCTNIIDFISHID